MSERSFHRQNYGLPGPSKAADTLGSRQRRKRDLPLPRIERSYFIFKPRKR
jgi:hypothetical protein